MKVAFDQLTELRVIGAHQNILFYVGIFFKPNRIFSLIIKDFVYLNSGNLQILEIGSSKLSFPQFSMNLVAEKQINKLHIDMNTSPIRRKRRKLIKSADAFMASDEGTQV